MEGKEIILTEEAQKLIDISLEKERERIIEEASKQAYVLGDKRIEINAINVQKIPSKPSLFAVRLLLPAAFAMSLIIFSALSIFEPILEETFPVDLLLLMLAAISGAAFGGFLTTFLAKRIASRKSDQ